jgi:phenylacetate-CoA ligase
MLRTLRYWHDRRRYPERYAPLRELLAVTRMSADQVAALQRRRFNAMVAHAIASTDFYAQRLLTANRGDVDPRSLPILTRQDVREHRDALLARDADRDRVRLGHTGGSTGNPLAFYYDEAKHALMLAVMKRGFMMSGWRPGQRVLYLWGAARDVSGSGVFARRGHGWLDSELTLEAVEYSESQLARWSDLIDRWRPVLLYGYASALAELAHYLIDSKRRPRADLLGVYSTAEPPSATQREQIQQAFGCRVFNQYGCREVPNIAWECRDGGMHVFSDRVLLESVPGDGGDQLLVTSLSDRLMPFIRYRLGDTGRLLDERCSCGLPLPLMSMELCRQNDLITVADGRRIHPAFFNGLMYGQNRVRQYQWRQLAPDHLELVLISDGPLSPDDAQSISARLRVRCGEQLRLDIHYVDQIPRSRSGKHRFVIGLGDRH